ncbi:MAG: S8 family serine peptidase, partial [Anaerolineales bacterium]|nr:S8 family serine peptidase [Anaerolineales bacterium]
NQTDTSEAEDIPSYTARRHYVYETLTEHANRTQNDLQTIFDNLGIDYTAYYLVNGLQVQGGPILRTWLEGRPEVDRVIDNPWLRPLTSPLPTSSGFAQAPTGPTWNLNAIKAIRVWDELGVTGAGIVIGQSDSGIDGEHPELYVSYRGVNSGHDYNWFDPWNGTTKPTDLDGHGTHSLGIIVGQRVGVAPGASWYGCVNLARNLGNPSLYLDCMQFMLAPFPIGGDPLKDGDPSLGAHISNNSWGCPQIEGCDSGALLPAVRALRDAGVFVVASAGNDGPNCESLSVPIPIYEEAYAVGSIDQFGQLSSFSSLGPVTVDGSGRTKPDLTAPGEEVLSAMPNNSYDYLSGTSFAGPHVAGVVALMWSANPILIGDMDRTEEILAHTAQPYTGNFPACEGASSNPSTAVG